MTDAQRSALEGLSCTITTAQEGDGWTSLFVEGPGISAYVLDSDEETTQALIDGINTQISTDPT